MKKKLLIMAMLVVASSLSYAKVGETNFGENYKIKFNEGFDGSKVDGNKIRWAGVDTLNKVQGEFKEVQTQLDGKVDKGEFNDLQSHVDAVEADKDALRDEVNANKQELNDKIDANKNELNNKIDKNNAIIQGEIDRVDGIVQSNKVENDKQNNRLDKVETENENQNTAIEGLQSQTNHNSENIETNKQNIETNKNAIDKETADRVAADQEIMNNIEKYNGQYEARMNAMDKKIDNLDEKMNKGLSLMAAMNAVDFQDVQEGEMAIGAGVGHYGNAQSVAVGVAYSPSQNLNVNMKYSVTAGDVDSFAVGAGASYKFRVK